MFVLAMRNTNEHILLESIPIFCGINCLSIQFIIRNGLRSSEPGRNMCIFYAFKFVDFDAGRLCLHAVEGRVELRVMKRGSGHSFDNWMLAVIQTQYAEYACIV